MSERFPPDDLEDAFVAGAIAALDKRVAALRARASIGITIVDSEHGSATIISSEAAAVLRLAGDFEEIVRELRGEAI